MKNKQVISLKHLKNIRINLTATKNLESGNSDLQAHQNSRMLIPAVTPTMALQIKKVYNPHSEVWHPRNVSIRNKPHREF